MSMPPYDPYKPPMASLDAPMAHDPSAAVPGSVVEILGKTRIIHVTLVVDGVFDRDGGLQDETLEEVPFVEAQRPSTRCGDDEFGKNSAVAGQ